MIAPNRQASTTGTDWVKQATDFANSLDQSMEARTDYRATASRMQKRGQELEQNLGPASFWQHMSPDMKSAVAVAVDAAGGLGRAKSLIPMLQDWGGEQDLTRRAVKQQQIADQLAVMIGQKPASDETSKIFAARTWNMVNGRPGGDQQGQQRAEVLAPEYADNTRLANDGVNNSPQVAQKMPQSDPYSRGPSRRLGKRGKHGDALIPFGAGLTNDMLRQAKETLAPNKKGWSAKDHARQEKVIMDTTKQAAKDLSDFKTRFGKLQVANAGQAVNAEQAGHGKNRHGVPTEYIAFDGQRMMHIRNDKILRAWPAVSGKKGFQRGQYQTLEKTGPLPEGRWLLQQDRLQNWNEINFFNQMASEQSRRLSKWSHRFLGRPGQKYGAWPGAKGAWGQNRIPISGPDGAEKPARFGRSGFFVHGGLIPGSAGCIDATEYMADFTAWFKKQGQDLPLIVSYKE